MPASVSMFIDASGMIYLAYIYFLKSSKNVIFDDLSKSFSIWLLTLIFWVFWAYHQLGIEGLVGLREWIRLFSFLLIYLLSKELVRIKGYEYLMNCILLSLVTPLVVGGYQIFSKQGRYIADIHRIYGTLAHPNAFSLYLTLFIGVTIWKLKFSEKPKFWYGLILILFIEQIGTFSLGGMVMMVSFLFVFIIGEFEAKGRLLSFLILAIFSAIFFGLESGQERIARLHTMPALQEIWNREIVTNSFSWRIVNWKLLFEQWAKNPLLGYGLYTSGLVNPWRGYAAHNDYIRFLIELGTIGIAIFVWFQFKIASNLVNKYKYCQNVEQKYLAMLMGGIYFSMIIGSSVDNHISYTTFHFYFWALLACVMHKSTEKSGGNGLNMLTQSSP
ncbi:MAG: O-antigen ligase family protein [Candidatus Thorarchaeota archaeon]